MRKPKYIVELSEEKRANLLKFSKSKAKSVTEKCRTRAKVILHLDVKGKKPLSPEQTAQKCKLHLQTVYDIRKAIINEGEERIITRKKREVPPVEAKVTGEVEARIIAIACSEPTDGHARWTMQLIANKIVLEGVLESISDTTVQRTLKKHNISLI